MKFTPGRPRGGNRSRRNGSQAHTCYETPSGRPEDYCTTNHHAAHDSVPHPALADQPRHFVDNHQASLDTTQRGCRVCRKVPRRSLENCLLAWFSLDTCPSCRCHRCFCRCSSLDRSKWFRQTRTASLSQHDKNTPIQPRSANDRLSCPCPATS